MQIAFWITLTRWSRPSSSTDKREPSCTFYHPCIIPRTLYCSSFYSSVSFFYPSPAPFLSLFLWHCFSCCNTNGEVYDIPTRAFSIARAAFVMLLAIPSDLLATDGIIFLILYTLAIKLTRADKSLLKGNCRCGFYHVREFFRCNTRLGIYIDYFLYLLGYMP